MKWKSQSKAVGVEEDRPPGTRPVKALAALILGGAFVVPLLVSSPAGAYAPTPGVMYAPTQSEISQINKTTAVVYPKSAVLPNGRLVAAFERSIGNPVGQTLPLYKSDDSGTTWQPLGTLGSPAALTAGTSRAAQFAKYTSNWTNPYLYTLKQDVGDLKAGTLLLASLVSGQDELYAEKKAADPNWTPQRDGDRRDLAIALYASTDGNGGGWQFLNIIAQGGWSGSYGDPSAISQANTFKQVDPVWEPYLMEYNGQLVAYYTDEVDYTGFDPNTGVLQRDPNWQTDPDTVNQILAHRTWDGRTATAWSEPVADEVGGTTVDSTGTNILGAGRPGMTNVVPTTDGKWILTAEFGVTKISDNPLRFFDKPRVNLVDKGLNPSGSPVQIVLPDPADPTKWRLAFNSAATGGDVYVNETGSSTGTWVPYRTSVGNGYSRNLTYVPQTGRVVILRGNFGIANPIEFGEVDLGNSEGTYYQLVNHKTGDVLGTGGASQDTDFSNRFITTEAAGPTVSTPTQAWHLITKPNGTTTFLNKSGGRSLAIWGGASNAGAQLAQWNDDNQADKLWKVIDLGNGFVKIQSTGNATLYATAGARASNVTLQPSTSDGSQEWQLITINAPVDPTPTPTPTPSPTPSSTTSSTPSPQPSQTSAPPTTKPAPSISLSSSFVTAGQQITVNASGFSPEETVEIWLSRGPVKLATTTAGEDGRISEQVTIPSRIPAGNYTISARGTRGHVATASITVTDGLAVTGLDGNVAASIGLAATALVFGGLVTFLARRRKTLR